MATWQKIDGSVSWPEWPDTCSCGAELPDVCDGSCPDCGEPHINLISQTCDDCGDYILPDDEYWLCLDGGDVICLDCMGKRSKLERETNATLAKAYRDAAKTALDAALAILHHSYYWQGYPEDIRQRYSAAYRELSAQAEDWRIKADGIENGDENTIGG